MASAMHSCSGSLGPLQSDRSWSWSHLKGALAHMTGHGAGRRLRSQQGLSPSHLHRPLRVVCASSQHGSWVPRVRVPREWSGSKTITSAVVTSLPRSAWRKLRPHLLMGESLVDTWVGRPCCSRLGKCHLPHWPPRKNFQKEGCGWPARYEFASAQRSTIP